MNYFVYHQQTYSIAEYEGSFLELKRWTETWNEDKLDEKWIVSIFVKGLKEEIKENLYCSNSLQKAIVLEKWRKLSFAGKVFDKKAERVVTQDEPATNGIIDESRISFGISSNAAVNLNLDFMKLDNQASETFCTNQQVLSIVAKALDEKTERNGYIISLDRPDPPDDYGTTLIINESNFSIHLKSMPITSTSGYGVINCLMVDNFKVKEFCANKDELSNAGKVFEESPERELENNLKPNLKEMEATQKLGYHLETLASEIKIDQVNGVLTCLFKAEKQVYDDKAKESFLKSL